MLYGCPFVVNPCSASFSGLYESFANGFANDVFLKTSNAPLFTASKATKLFRRRDCPDKAANASLHH